MLLTEITEHNKQYKNKDLPSLNLLILRDITLDPIEHFYRYYSNLMGYHAAITWGNYNTIYQDSYNLSSDYDFIFIFPKLEMMTENLTYKFSRMRTEDIQLEISNIIFFFKGVFSNIRQSSNAVILWHSFEVPLYPNLGIFDTISENSQLEIINNINSLTKGLAYEFKGVYCVDTNLCQSRLGNFFYDRRMWYSSKMPYSLDGLKEIANEDFKYIRALKGKNKKCLVLDCDNTLWGGIVGEDGIEKIQLDEKFINFHREIINLYYRGIIIALVSKNNEDDVWEAFRKRNDMTLKKEHIATSQINWDDKATNIKIIAENLNIGLDSIVFADDSVFECNLVKSLIPEIETLHMNKPMDYSIILASCGLFDTVSLSDEDKKRGQMYKEDLQRKKIKSDKTNLLEYYTSLEMNLEISKVTNLEVGRASQLTQRTNQFNFTTRRYSEEDIKHFIEDPSHDIYYVKARDNIGDLGIVGLIILRYEDESAFIDSFLMSCRALGRTIEDAFLMNVILQLERTGIKRIIGLYSETKKNIQVKDYYERYGFINNKNCWVLYTDNLPKKDFSYFKNIEMRE